MAIKIWEYTVTSDLTPIQCLKESGMKLRNDMYGKRVAEYWKPVWVYPVIPYEKHVNLGDFVFMAFGFTVFSAKAVETLKPLIEDYVEFLPLRWYPYEHRDLYAVNVLSVLECLDEEQSDIKRFESSGRISRIDKYVFKEDCIGDVPIFHINPVKTVFVSDAFRQLAEDAELVGLDLKPVPQ